MMSLYNKIIRPIFYNGTYKRKWKGLLTVIAANVLTLFLVLCVGVGLFCIIFHSDCKADDYVYSWKTEDGVTSFTDSRSMIPERYRKQVTIRTKEELNDYKKIIIADTPKATKMLFYYPPTPKIAPPSKVKYIAPLRAVREMRYVENIRGYSGNRYVSVDVLYDANDTEITWALSEIGLSPAALLLGFQ